MMAGRGIQGPSAIETRGFVPGLSRKIVLGAALVLAVLGALVVWAGAAAVDRLGFESMRQRGASLARLLALASEQALERSGADALKPLLDTITGAATWSTWRSSIEAGPSWRRAARPEVA